MSSSATCSNSGQFQKLLLQTTMHVFSVGISSRAHHESTSGRCSLAHDIVREIVKAASKKSRRRARLSEEEEQSKTVTVKKEEPDSPDYKVKEEPVYTPDIKREEEEARPLHMDDPAFLEACGSGVLGRKSALAVPPPSLSPISDGDMEGYSSPSPPPTIAPA